MSSPRVTMTDGSGTSSQVPENRTQTQYIVNGGMDWYIDNSNTLTFSTTFDYEHHYDTAQVAYINLNDSERYRYWTLAGIRSHRIFKLSPRS